ncbi:radical SAM protein, partial [Mitsuokella sp.]|uniref:radical SAM protein n=1 Tax=Mitsuokella sp. TaxID=2049034 RepID=UPI003D7EF04D
MALRIKTFTLNNKKEIISKIVREVLVLFKVEIVGRRGEADYLQLSVINHRLKDTKDGRVVIESKLMLFDREGHECTFTQRRTGALDEREGASVNRLIKLNLYHIFREELGMPQAPWGILHGVRPTKIVHRWIRGGMDEAGIIERLQEDYACSEEKAREIVPMAFRQLPFLKTSDEKTVSVYIGIPFCLTRCLYCSFPSNILPGDKKLRQFMDVLKKDMTAAKDAISYYGFHVQNIYVGGGTPTSLPDDFFAEMLEMVYNDFHEPSTVEFTVEAGRPDSITQGKIETMKRLHVTRVSVNPQTMQAKTL